MAKKALKSTIHLARPTSDRRIPKVLLSYEEAAWSIGISSRTVERWVSEGLIPVVQIHGIRGIDPADLEALKSKHKVVKNQS